MKRFIYLKGGGKLGVMVVMAGRAVCAVAMTSETKRHFSDSYLADVGTSSNEESTKPFVAVSCRLTKEMDSDGHIMLPVKVECISQSVWRAI